jgi:phosphatidylglycerophosphatase C
VRECVLLDFDGTITIRDTTRYLLIELIKLRPLRVFGAAWFVARMVLSSESHSIQKYKNRAIGHLIAGSSDSDISDALLSFSEVVNPLFRPLFREKIKQHDKSGALVLIVTASPSFAINKCLSGLPVSVIGTVFDQVSGKYSGQLQSPNCYGEEKVSRIVNWRKKNSLSLYYTEAWSDHFSDYPMLKMAEKRYWIGGALLKKLVYDRDPLGDFVFKED